MFLSFANFSLLGISTQLTLPLDWKTAGRAVDSDAGEIWYFAQAERAGMRSFIKYIRDKTGVFIFFFYPLFRKSSEEGERLQKLDKFSKVSHQYSQCGYFQISHTNSFLDIWLFTRVLKIIQNKVSLKYFYKFLNVTLFWYI